jgi:5'-nucleotidase
MGDDATYSGTVAGALESTILGVPGLAFSLAAYREHDFSQSVEVAKEITQKALTEGLPVWTLLNVNVPKGVPAGIRITKQGFKSARPIISEHIDPRGKLYYWIGEVREGFRAEGGTDFEAIDEGYVSVTPMRSDLTSHSGLEKLKNWNSDR